MLPRITLVALLGILPAVRPGALAAQDSTGTLIVRVRRAADSLPLAGAFVRSGRIGGVTDDSGLARVELPATLLPITVSHGGFTPQAFEITIVANARQRVELALDVLPADAVPVDVTRSRRPRGAEATPVAVIGREALAEEVQAHPSDIARLLGAQPGIRLQPASGPLEGARLRLRGLPGDQTGVLIDGLPLLGLDPGAYGLLQLAPLDLDRIEILRGAATALYGPGAPGGVVNLVPHRPDRNGGRVAVNQTSEKGGDVMLWGARRLTPTLGGTLSADFHQQRHVDADGDGWGEFARAVRIGVRPRVFLDLPSGDGLTATAGVSSEDRTGGFLLSDIDEDPYRQERRVRRLDGGVNAWRLIGRTGRLRLRVAGAYQSTSMRFDDLRERDHRSTLFGELSYTDRIGAVSVTGGVVVQRDVLRASDYPEFNYTYTAPAVFAQVGFEPSAATAVSLGARCDRHNLYGVFCTPRASFLVRPSSDLEVRLDAGAGFRTPTPFAGEVETLGLHGVVATGFNAERLLTAALEATWHGGPVTLGATLAAARVSGALQLVPAAGDPEGRLRLLNAAEPTRIVTAGVTAGYRAEPFTASAFYVYQYATEDNPAGAGRRFLALTPVHALGADLAWRRTASGTLVDVELAYTGQQSVWDNPRRTRTPGYAVTNLLVSQRTGRARLYVSGENLFDVRLRTYEPVFLATPGLGDRRTSAPWAPLRGRVISLGAMVDW